MLFYEITVVKFRMSQLLRHHAQLSKEIMNTFSFQCTKLIYIKSIKKTRNL